MTPGTVRLVDDDAAIRDALSWLLRTRGITTETYASAEDLLAAWRDNWTGVLVLDVRMDGMSGTELFDELQARGCRLPAIFLTGHGDVPLAVRALKQGAFDFIEKPFNDNELVDRIAVALEIEAQRRSREAGDAGIANRMATLTEREREVMQRILAGKLNKVIADELAIAMRTVEVHRARIFAKMGVRSAVELAQLLSKGGTQ